MSCRAMRRPVCPKCGGVLLPETEIGGRVMSVGCIICGERIYRDHKRRSPDALERNAHKLAGRPALNGKGLF
ncbi:MAG: hypothetical protein PHO83_03735 [Geobacteraceae bacterium]|nr:hypothetical protein [Geobacteraceae bacterium]